MNKNLNDSAKKLTGFQLLMLVLCIYVLGALLVEVTFQLPPQVSSLLQTLDTVICFIFLADFFTACIGRKNASPF
jgi:voltage-gated potassium channel